MKTRPMMKSYAKVMVIAVVLSTAALAIADKLSDFKDAVGREGCDSIPYSDLRSNCKTQQSYVHDWCDGNKGPVTCGSEGITRQLKDKLGNETRGLQALKEKRRKLEDDRSRASTEDEKNRLTKEIEQVEKDIYEAEKRVEQASAELQARGKHVENAIYTINYCIDYRSAVMNNFAAALERVRNETDEEIKPYARQLRDKYEASKGGHEVAITDKKNALRTCQDSRP